MKFGDILSEKVDRRREWHAKFNQGVNDTLPCQKFSSRQLRSDLRIHHILRKQVGKSFRRASRSPAVQVTGSAYALSRWEGASPLGGV